MGRGRSQASRQQWPAGTDVGLGPGHWYLRPVSLTPQLGTPEWAASLSSPYLWKCHFTLSRSAESRELNVIIEMKVLGTAPGAGGWLPFSSCSHPSTRPARTPRAPAATAPRSSSSDIRPSTQGGWAAGPAGALGLSPPGAGGLYLAHQRYQPGRALGC